jgi:hypothetical protein
VLGRRCVVKSIFPPEEHEQPGQCAEEQVKSARERTNRPFAHRLVEEEAIR